MIYEQKTRLLRRGLFHVQNEVGVGRHEEAYHQAYCMWLTEQGVPHKSKPAQVLTLGGEVAHTLHPDVVAWDSITIELKALPRRLRDEERVQIFDYLKCREDKLGLLANLGLDRVHVERIVYETPEYELHEDWQHWADSIGGDDRSIGRAVRAALMAVCNTHGPGYGMEVTTKLTHFSLRQQRLPFTVAPACAATYQGEEVGDAPLDCIVVADRVLLVFTALFDSNDFNISRGLSYMRGLGFHWGIAANFGKKAVALTGLRA